VEQQSNKISYIDSHAHIDLIKDSAFNVISSCKNNNIDYILNVGFNYKSSLYSINLSLEYPSIFSSIGVHPHYVDIKELNEIKILLQNNIKNEKNIAIGEIGLDYVRSLKSKEEQKIYFEEQLQLAEDFNKPVIIHNRNSDDDIIEIIDNFKNIRGVFHCFSSDIEFAKKILDKGFFVSFTGNITYIKNDKLREVIKYIPINRLLLETDSPYLSPQNIRGKENNPCNVKYIYNYVTELLNVDLALLSNSISNNFFNLFERSNHA
jgi:TatD DNase family protein